MTFPELGNALNSLLSPEVYEHSGNLGAPLFLSVGFCIVSVICGIILVLIDMKADKVFKYLIFRSTNKMRDYYCNTDINKFKDNMLNALILNNYLEHFGLFYYYACLL